MRNTAYRLSHLFPMPDLIPEGCISLCAAYDSFASGLWSGRDSVAELRDRITYAEGPPQLVGRSKASLAAVTDSMLAEFRYAFATGSLGALVRPSGAHENFAIPQDSWAWVHFPERAFLSEKIVPGHGGYWDGLVGRIPFVRRSEFDPWLSAKIDRKCSPEAIPSPAIQALRTHLIGLAQSGFLPSGEVENLASRWGLEPFASTPAEERHDPMKLSHWTLAMAASWIVWRDINCVRRAMDSYRSESWEWNSFGRQFLDRTEPYQVFGEELRRPDPLSLMRLGTIEATGFNLWDRPMLMSIKSAREALWQHLGEDVISAAAVDDAGKHVIVPPHHWAGLVLAASRSGCDYLCFMRDSLRPAYTEIKLPRLEILSLWPPSRPDETAVENEEVGLAAQLLARMAPRPITCRIDNHGHRVLFTAGPVLRGGHCDLFALLADQFLSDIKEGLEKSAYRFVSTQCITARFAITDHNLRQRVRRMRRSLEKQFINCAGYSVSAQTIVESQNWTGYRLNPDWVVLGTG
jgi:hypothetical protein